MTPQQVYLLAIGHHQAGRLAQAASLYQQILAQYPDQPNALHMLGVIEHQTGNHHRAIELIERSLSLHPANTLAHGNLGMALAAIGEFEPAIAAFERALALQANHAPIYYNLGVACLKGGRIDRAIAAFTDAIRLLPTYAEAHNNLGNAFRAARRLEEALAAHHHALAVRPQYPEARLNTALVRLLQGQWEAAWPDYEARWEVGRNDPQRGLSHPRWNGEELAGRRILIHAEQGMGDVIQMIRYLPLVVERGGHVILECHPPLKRLLARVSGVSEIVARGETLPPFDIHAPIVSLPGIFRTTPQTIPMGIPYIQADQAQTDSWRDRIEQLGPGRKVGLVWAGQPIPPGRSIPPGELAPLAQLSGLHLISLQVGASERPNLPGLIDWTDQLHDFADTAALLANLDLLITIDTAAAHLAGAMGKPAWVLLSHEPDWRWTLDRAESPWYPTLRLFRQPRPGDWATPIAEVARQLAGAA